MRSFHFSLGDSSNGPIGFCARIKAEDKEGALAGLRDAIEALNREIKGPDDLGDDVEYIEVYFNPDKISVADIDDAAGDDASGESDSCECDNTHQQNDTVCQWCWARGRRHWNDPEVQE